MFNIEPSFASETDKQFIDANKDAILLLLDKVKSDESFSEVKQGLDLHVPHQKISKNTKRDTSINNESDVEPDDFEGM